MLYYINISNRYDIVRKIKFKHNFNLKIIGAWFQSLVGASGLN